MTRMTGYELLKLRRAAGWTRGYMAHVAGITPTGRLARYERGDLPIPQDVIQRVEASIKAVVARLSQ